MKLSGPKLPQGGATPLPASKSAVQLTRPSSKAEGTGLGVSEYKMMSLAYQQHEKQRRQREQLSKSPILQSRTTDASEFQTIDAFIQPNRRLTETSDTTLGLRMLS